MPATLALCALLIGAHAAASAQGINRCRIDGRLVLQSAPCPLDAPRSTGAAAIPTPTAATTATTGPKKRTLADVLRERDGEARPSAPLREAQGDGAHILRPRMGAG